MKKYLSRVIAAFLALTLLAAPASALTVDQALELLEENYYFDIPEHAYEAATLEELFRFLGDPYTEYMSAEQYAAFVDMVEDTVNMVGVGVVIKFTDEGMLIQEVLSGGSALEAGLQPGDLIVAVDGTSCVPAGEEQRVPPDSPAPGVLPEHRPAPGGLHPAPVIGEPLRGPPDIHRLPHPHPSQAVSLQPMQRTISMLRILT